MNPLCSLKNPITIEDLKPLSKQETITILTSRLKEAQSLGLYKSKKDIDQIAFLSDFQMHL